MKIWQRFLMLAVVAISGQYLLWQLDALTDAHTWEKRVVRLSQDLTSDFSEVAINKYIGHPGTSFTFPASLLHLTGISASTSLLIAVSAVTGLLIALLGTLAWRLYPNEPWWIAAFAIALVHPLYLQASPTNAIMMVVVPLTVLVVWGFSQHPNRNWALVLGVVLGVGLATRWASTGVLILTTFIFLFRSFSLRLFIFTNAVALLTFIVLDPVLWMQPLWHINFLWQRVNVHYSQIEQYAISGTAFGLFAPLAFLAIALAALYFLPRLRQLRPVPPLVLGYLAALTIIDCIVFFTATNPSMRYFFPDIVSWEMLLPLLLIPLVRQSHIPFSLSPLQWKHISGWIPILLIIGGELMILAFALTLPDRPIFIDWQQLSPQIRPHGTVR